MDFYVNVVFLRYKVKEDRRLILCYFSIYALFALPWRVNLTSLFKDMFRNEFLTFTDYNFLKQNYAKQDFLIDSFWNTHTYKMVPIW